MVEARVREVWFQVKVLSGDKPNGLVGRARGLMEPLDPRYRKNRCRENRRIPARREPAPGNLSLLLQGRQHSPK